MSVDPHTLDSLTAGLPPALADVATAWIRDFAAQHDVATLEPRHAMLAAISEFAGSTMLRQWGGPDAAGIRRLEVPDPAALERFVERVGASEAPPDAVKQELRLYRHRVLTAILAEDMERPERFTATLERWSAFADAMLDAASRYAAKQTEARFGRVVGRQGEPVTGVIIGMGKLGGRELNFSSDIDLIFLYAGRGESDGPKCVTAETWFTRFSQQVVRLLDDVTADGFVFRVDTRLRPFGDSGAPVTSLAALETYLLNHGRTWERYAYVKARAVGPAVPRAVRDELFERLIRPFVYRRYLDYGIFESLRDMHSRIAAEVERRELRHNLKLGPGGIREIEFIVQSVQLLRGGTRPAFRATGLLEVLPELANGRPLSDEECAELRDAYVLLRRAENFIQGIRDRQTHDIPSDPLDCARVAHAMGSGSWTELAADIEAARQRVRRQFESVAFGPEKERPVAAPIANLWQDGASASSADTGLDGDEAEQFRARVARFRDDPGTQRADAIALRRLEELMPILLEHIVASPAPTATLERVLRIVTSVMRRSAYLALLIENPGAAERLVDLCSRSRYIADELAQYPVLLDELLDARVHGEGLTKPELEASLAAHLEHVGYDDAEDAVEALAQYQRATLFRIAVADFNDRLELMKVSDALTFLAEVVLAAALDIAWHELVVRHGAPHFDLDGERRAAGFGIVAYGKLGGLELSYGSDLDIVFVNDSEGGRQETDGQRPLANAVFFVRLARRLIHYLTTQTRSGVLYEIDTRLRPSGRKGLLVTTLDAFARYQSDDAWTWEHQALLRARAVAGSPAVAERFAAIRAATLTTAIRRDTLKDDVIDMRRKMRAELDRSTDESFDLKHGAGGLGDIEFLVQYLVLANANRYAALIEYSDNIRQLDALRDTAILDARDATVLQDAYRAYRRRQHHLTLDDRPPLVSAGEFAAEAAAVRTLWLRHLGD